MALGTKPKEVQELTLEALEGKFIMFQLLYAATFSYISLRFCGCVFWTCSVRYLKLCKNLKTQTGF
jgi:hypothetical protein